MPVHRFDRDDTSDQLFASPEYAELYSRWQALRAGDRREGGAPPPAPLWLSGRIDLPGRIIAHISTKYKEISGIDNLEHEYRQQNFRHLLASDREDALIQRDLDMFGELGLDPRLRPRRDIHRLIREMGLRKLRQELAPLHEVRNWLSEGRYQINLADRREEQQDRQDEE
tara:strand:+ start:1317 stop:1826 length:510 start_codon:yes stop_codon:yes gene_type:complete